MNFNPQFSRIGVLAIMVYCALLIATVPDIVSLFMLFLPWSSVTGVPKEAFFQVFFAILNGLIIYLLVAALDPDYEKPGEPLI